MAKRFNTSNGPSQRQLRAGELLRHALAEIFQREELRAEELDGMTITITEVKASPDLKNAKVYYTPLGSTVSDVIDIKKKNKPLTKALNGISPHVRGLLGKKIDLKYTPTLTFHIDESFEEAGRIDTILLEPKVVRDLEAKDTSD